MQKQKTLFITAVSFATGVLLTYFFLSSESNFLSSESNFLSSESNKHQTSDSAKKTKEPLYWVAPMDPNFRRDKPGKSPMNMDLIPVYANDRQQNTEPGVVWISPQVENNLGVKVNTIHRQNLNLDIDTVGFITFDEERVIHFHSRVDGWIEGLSVTAIGDEVTKGQKLFDLYAPELVNVQEEYITALKTTNSQLTKAAERKMRSLGISNTEIGTLKNSRHVKQHISFHAKKDGYVASLNVREGSFIKPTTNVISIGNLDTVWVIAEIFERQAGWIKTGQQVTMSTNAYPGQQWLGKVDYVYPVLNNQTRTLQARIIFNNEDHRLKPNMYTRLSIKGEELSNVLSIPKAAIISNGQMTRVVKALGDGEFKSVRIQTGMEINGLVEIRQGLREGDKLVISSQFLLDSESSISADLSRMENTAVESETNDTHHSDTTLEKASRVWASGILQILKTTERTASITHDPIPEWDWPMMTMDFSFSDEVDLSKLKNNQKIQFCLDKLPDNEYSISHVEIDHSPSPQDQQELPQ